MSNKTIAEFLEHHKQFSLFRPASPEEAGLFYSEPDQRWMRRWVRWDISVWTLALAGKVFSIPGGLITKINSTPENLRRTFRKWWMPFVPMVL